MFKNFIILRNLFDFYKKVRIAEVLTAQILYKPLGLCSARQRL